MNYLGIDCGKTGAVAIINADRDILLLEDMPLLGKELDVLLIRDWLTDYGGKTGLCAAIEYQQSFPKQGIASAFNLGENYGMLKGLVLGTYVPFTTPRPVAWKKALDIPAGSDKGVSLMMARRFFPTANLGKRADQGRSDALLIAEWCRRSWSGEMQRGE